MHAASREVHWNEAEINIFSDLLFQLHYLRDSDSFLSFKAFTFLLTINIILQPLPHIRQIRRFESITKSHAPLISFVIFVLFINFISFTSSSHFSEFIEFATSKKMPHGGSNPLGVSQSRLLALHSDFKKLQANPQWTSAVRVAQSRMPLIGSRKSEHCKNSRHCSHKRCKKCYNLDSMSVRLTRWWQACDVTAWKGAFRNERLDSFVFVLIYLDLDGGRGTKAGV